MPSRLLFSITLDPKHISPQRMEEGAGAFRPLTIASEKNEGLQPRRKFPASDSIPKRKNAHRDRAAHTEGAGAFRPLTIAS